MRACLRRGVDFLPEQGCDVSRFLFMVQLGLKIGAHRYDLVSELCERYLRKGAAQDRALANRFAALAYENLGRWDDALRHSLAAVEVDPQDFSMLRVVARSLVEGKRFEEAKSYAVRMLEAADKQAQLHGVKKLLSSQIETGEEKTQWVTWAKEYLNWVATRG
jgi:hypothetical protein